ncbi:probable LRR receptor-like serine/threonine-protein kinase At3g47570 [Durio zibethinus]|uniref:non-specific serine/threonine protein kinase n=1 Tax=Durio zibethinus TaxID=66656 RepID=A0A6P5WPC5_DURZI|nr:probable LRR receptor-like serine/threonine-protein kinase At3g47570 [Durio zibethinus]
MTKFNCPNSFHYFQFFINPRNIMRNTRFFFPLVIVLLFHNFVTYSLSVESPNITTDQSSLFALKSHVTFGLQSQLKTNWSTATSVCNWIGVTCGSRHLRVTALNLSGMGLVGTIPPHLGNLSFLSLLSIENNSFHGSLPIQLANLRRLKYINFGNNNISGEIPSWFDSLTQLQSLFLYGNNFTGEIPSSLCYFPKLEILRLDNNKLQGQIPVMIGNLSSLRKLILDYNQLSGSMPPSIFNISSLQLLDLSDNNLSGSIPPIPLKIFSLQFIDLTVNALSGKLSSDMFDRLPNLQGLYLNRNLFSGRIPPSLFKCKELTILSLFRNQFEGSLPMEIGNLTKLRILHLRENNLEGKIPSSIWNLTFLWFLDFSSNSLSGTLPNQIGNLQNLEFIQLGNNSFTGVIPPSIFNISTARYIVLAFNRFSGQLPSTTGLGLPNLQMLHLGLNELSGPIPISISNATQLIQLHLLNNSFSGIIPDTLGNLRHLQRLDLSHNNLSSNPSSRELSFLLSLTNCKDLDELIFDDNPLVSGELPISVGNLSASLTLFYGSLCNIKGNIPSEIGNLSNLVWLGFDHNNLTGPIPPTIGGLRDLQNVNLGSNKLEGSIPSELCHLERLAFLTLTDNRLSGPIPACLGDLVSLRNLFLGVNNFTSIPSTLTRLNGILFLELASNSLSGTLPVDIGKWSSVTNLNLSENQFSGTIPSSIAKLAHLTHLSISGNMLQGSIPQSFDELISLEYLDLSRNNLSGMIPKSLEKLPNLKYLNVSFNRLQGEIPNGGSFVNYSSQSFMGNEALCGSSRLQVPPCKTDTGTELLKYILPAIGSAILILAMIIIFLRNRKAEVPNTEENLPPLHEWRRISYHELDQATDGFSESKLLGVGSFGSVYQGTLSNGISIAVKVFNVNIDRALRSFDVECEVLRKIRHRNLVKIISSCSNSEFKALVLEFMPNGSLEKWLYSHNHFLEVSQRLNIMIDIALAMEYLHHGHTPPVVHCDLKPNNVLLDNDMIAHLGDFGISKLISEEDLMTQTMTLATIGYMSPEYGSEGIVSTKGDIYSFGILLMETFTRKKPTDEMFSEETSLKCWVKESLPSAVVRVVDANLLNTTERKRSAAKDCILSILQLALECSAELPAERIDMKEVVARLKKIKIKFLQEVQKV